MKKYIQNILIIILLMLGFFSPVLKVQAQQSCNTPGADPATCIPSGTPATSAAPKSNYYFLAPLPCPQGTGGCNPQGQFTTFDPTASNSLSLYINTGIKIIIGLSAVFAVVMIVIGGIEYMTSELSHSKEDGKERIWNAVFGLLIALGSYALLNTINPDLLNSNINVPGVTVNAPITDFQISGNSALSSSGKDVKIDFNTQAYPAAANAESKTGIPSALILALFAQETGLGANTGGCLPTDTRARMKPIDQVDLGLITTGLNIDYSGVRVACAATANGTDFGGAIGLTQFLPSTWLTISQTSNATAILGHTPNPWDVNDALMMSALYLKFLGQQKGTTDPSALACGYAGACVGFYTNYGNMTAATMAKIQAQIDAAKASGKIK